MKWGEEIPQKFDLSSLRLLGSVGEPINPEAWMWYRRVIGGDHCPIVDTWWQTETGAIMISPLPGVTTLKPGSAQVAVPGIGVERAVLRELGESLEDVGNQWREDLQDKLLPAVASLDRARKFAQPLLTPKLSDGEIFLAPALSHDGSRIAFLSNGNVSQGYAATL